MALSGGSREILEAARKRLSAANSQAAAASTNLESVKQMIANMLQSAQSMSDAADKEVKDAQTALDEAEKKYEVIDVDGDYLNPTDNGGSSKRRKVSLSPQSQSNNDANSTARNNNNTTISTGQTNTDISTSSNNASATHLSNSNNVSLSTSSIAARSTSMSNTNGSLLNNNTSISFPKAAEQITVKDCGVYDINGTYTRVGDILGAPVYTKGGKESGTLNCFAILRSRSAVGEQAKWYIGNWGAQSDGNISFNFWYVSYDNKNCMFPPENGWYSVTGQLGIRAPTCRLLLPDVHIMVEGCGNVEVNGTYSRNFQNTNDREYSKRGKWNGQVVNFSIYQKYYMTSPNYKWYIGRSETPTSSGTNSNFALFRSAENNDMFPPNNGWKVIGTKRGGLYPGPTFRAVDIKQVTVEGCGLSKFDGSYIRADGQNGDAPQYVKYEQHDGKAETFFIVRIDKAKAWYIGIPGDESGGAYSVHVDRWDDHPNIPPKNGWTVAVGKGKHPAPKLTWH